MRHSIWGALVLLWACGSPGSVDGKVHGNNVTIHDSISASVAINGGTTVVHAAEIIMGNAQDFCADAATKTEHPNEQVVVISLIDVNGTTGNTPTAPGTYSIYQPGGMAPPKAALYAVRVNDANCATINAQSADATTGTVTLESVSGNKFSGKYDVALDSGDHVTGSFDPDPCPAIQQLLDSTAQPICQ